MWDRWWEWALRPRMMVLMTVLLLVSAYGHLTNNAFLQMYDPGWGVLLLAGIPLLFGGIEYLVKEKELTSWLLVGIALVACVGRSVRGDGSGVDHGVRRMARRTYGATGAPRLGANFGADAGAGAADQ